MAGINILQASGRPPSAGQTHVGPTVGWKTLMLAVAASHCSHMCQLCADHLACARPCPRHCGMTQMSKRKSLPGGKKPKMVKAAWKGSLWLWTCHGEAERKIYQTVCQVMRAAAFLVFPEATAGGGVWQSMLGVPDVWFRKQLSIWHGYRGVLLDFSSVHPNFLKKYTSIMLVYCFLGRPIGGCSTPIYKAEDLGSNSCLTIA